MELAMRKRWAVVAVALLGILGIPAVLFGWGANGHMMIGEAAALSLPDGMPAFFRAATKQLAYLNPEPDRWRRDAQEAEFGQWLRASGFEHYVLLELVPPDVLDAPNRYVYLDNLKDRGITSPVAALPIPGLLHLSPGGQSVPGVGASKCTTRARRG